MLETIIFLLLGEGFITLFHTKSVACFDNIGGSEPQKTDGHGHGKKYLVVVVVV
jgi:hypothetical protein